MNKTPFRKKPFFWFLIYALCLGVSLSSLTGCAALKKKFIRKKKQKIQEEFIPVLDPVDYAPKVIVPGERYQHHYSLWQVWQRDLIQSIESKESDKNQKYLLAQMIIQMEEMNKWLEAQKQMELAVLIGELAEVEQIYAKPAPLRSLFTLKTKINANAKRVRNQFSPKVIKDFFKK